MSSKKQDQPVAENAAATEAPQTVTTDSGTWLVLRGGGNDHTARPVKRPRPGPRKPVYMLKEGAGYVRLFPEDIVYIQTKGNYVEVHRPRSRVIVHSSLSEVLAKLPAQVMARINRAQAVNTRRIEHIGTDEVLVAEMVFTLSPRYREELLERLKVISDR